MIAAFVISVSFSLAVSSKLVKIGVGDFEDVDNSLASTNRVNELNEFESEAEKNFQQYFVQQLTDEDQTKKQTVAISDLPKKLDLNFDINKSLILPIIGNWLTGSDAIDSKSNADVSVFPNPNFSYNTLTDVLNIYKSNEGLKKAGIRGNGNFGAGYDSQSNILYNLLRSLNSFDANFNLRKGLDLKFQKGVDGLYTESDITNVNPLGLSFGNQKRICIAEFIIKGLCIQTGQGFNQKK